MAFHLRGYTCGRGVEDDEVTGFFCGGLARVVCGTIKCNALSTAKVIVLAEEGQEDEAAGRVWEGIVRGACTGNLLV